MAENRYLSVNPPRRIAAYARLLKINVPELSLYPLISFGLTAVHIQEARYWLINSGFLLFVFCCSALSISLDDLNGYIDGVDRLDTLNTKRNITKPLLTGELEQSDVRRAAACAVLLGCLLLVLVSTQTRYPAISVLLMVALMLYSAQYSAGLKLSYRGLGEVVLMLGIPASICLPVWLLAGSVPPGAIMVAAMMGLPYAAQIVISNLIDHDGDKDAGRLTLTIVMGPKRAAALLPAFLLATFWMIWLAGFYWHILPRLAICWIALLPLHVRYIALIRNSRYADARLLSFKGIRFKLLLVTVSTLLAGIAL
ncbi:UbiA family prenyltransferase [Streptomyces sp. NBC_01077]|uniref:UbiA family prenyltransferase n=1 Tax=Streptomyces sp. NBC_01077 TaxID=2903746 RepID=UPI00386F4CC8|nr:UbiA family prenyltransferase [Streptomyces sp. NBC_01077]WSV43795.1 UbiA family prenyltransferase [Streptomyces sp. NBC_01077]